MNKAKPFCISKQVVWDAYWRVKSRKGAAGVDDETLEQFEADLKNNLYKLWNRMSSGTYFPSAVREVQIPKKNGGMRSLGIPTVADRVAQMVVKMYLEPTIDPAFHDDSYGYRPQKSATQAVEKARERCWKYDWVVDVDIKGFFDNIDHELMMKAVKAHTRENWILLYIDRWLKAPVMDVTGELRERNKGTPQGGVISPLLANLFLHYALDVWLARNVPQVCFERYADDMVIHCKTREQAEGVLQEIRDRLKQCGLELNEGKSKIVYCKDHRRIHEHEANSFDFLGFTFRARKVRLKDGRMFYGFNPGISVTARKAIMDRIRSWRLHLWCTKTVREVATEINAVVSGWIQYYGAFYRSAMYPIWRWLNQRLMKWACRKYKKLRGSYRKALMWLKRVFDNSPTLFVHWRLAAVS